MTQPAGSMLLGQRLAVASWSDADSSLEALWEYRSNVPAPVMLPGQPGRRLVQGERAHYIAYVPGNIIHAQNERDTETEI